MPSEQKNLELVAEIITILRKATKGKLKPAASLIINQFGRDPYLLLISCILSLRTKDATSFAASQRLFQFAKSPEEMLTLSVKKIEHLIYPVGFYRQKAGQLQAISRAILDQFGGDVPCTEEELLTLKGVGRKTANLVLSEAFGVPAICVDVHVHRISNRLGLVATETPKETEIALKQVLPKRYWAEWNRLLVTWGQNVCTPISPFCSRCAVASLCQRVGVNKSR